MANRLSLLAFPAVCIALMVGMAACAGSGGNNPTPHPPTLAETVRAVREARTPAQGAFAYNQVQVFVGVADSAAYQSLAQTSRDEIAQLFGTAIASDNASPSPSLTYAAAVTASNEAFGTVLGTDAVLDQLNDDLAAAESDPSVPARASLQLLLALEGGGAVPTKHLGPASGLLFSQWFALRMVPDNHPLVRSACSDGCSMSYAASVDQANWALLSVQAGLKLLYMAGFINLGQYEGRRVELFGVYVGLLQQAEARYISCTDACHGQ